MTRTTVNFWLDTLLLLLFTVLAWVAALLRFVFPPGTEAGGWMLWGLGYDDWARLQFTLTAVLLAAIVLHVMLHWSWVCGVVASFRTNRKKGKVDDGIRTLYGVGLLVVLLHVLGIGLTAAVLTIEDPAQSTTSSIP